MECSSGAILKEKPSKGKEGCLVPVLRKILGNRRLETGCSCALISAKGNREASSPTSLWRRTASVTQWELCPNNVQRGGAHWLIMKKENLLKRRYWRLHCDCQPNLRISTLWNWWWVWNLCIFKSERKDRGSKNVFYLKAMIKID